LELNDFYQAKRDLFLEAIKDSKFSFTPTKGTYFQLLNYSNITDKNDVTYSLEMVKKHQLASIPISPFNTNNLDNNVLRFCFAKKDETILKAAEILCKIN
jgi:methionine aminotransferase